MSMRHTAIALALTAIAATLHAAPPPIVIDIEANYQQTQTLPPLTLQQGGDAAVRFRLTSGGRYLSLAGLTARWDGRSTMTSTQALQSAEASAVTSTTPNYIQCVLDYTATGTPVTNWTWAAVIIDGAAQYVMGTGALNIAESAWTGEGSTLIAGSYETAATNGHGTVGQVFATDGAGNNYWGDLGAGDVTAVRGGTGISVTGGESGSATVSVSTATMALITGAATQTGLAATSAADRVYADGLVDDLSGVTNPATARDNLGLGTASTNPATAFATAAQGLLADTALQVESDPVASSNLTAHIDDTTAAHAASAVSVTGTAGTVQAQLTGLESGKVSTTDATYTQAVAQAAAALPKSGGTMTGNLIVTNASIRLTDGEGYETWIKHAYDGLWIGQNDPFPDGPTGAYLWAGYSPAAPGAGMGFGSVGVAWVDGERSWVVHTNMWWGPDRVGTPYMELDARGLQLGYGGTRVYQFGTLATQSVVAASSVTVTNVEGNVQAAITALKAADTSADRTPYMLAYASTVTVSRANTDLQQLEPITGACTIVFPSGVTNYASCIELVIPPVGTQTVALATGPTYYYGDSLTGPSTTNYTHALWQSVYGTTNATCRIYRGAAQ
jgi:hypothetical protein